MTNNSNYPMTIYVAGPMSGRVNFNYEAFNAAAAVLREAGYTVLNPAEFDGGGQNDSFHNYMRKDLAIIIAEADALVCLQDWETSAGAKNEVSVARAIGIPVWDISEFAPVPNNPPEELWAKDHPEAPAPPDQATAYLPSWVTQYSYSAPGNISWDISTTPNTTSNSTPATPVEAYTEGWDGAQSDTSILLEAEEAVNGDRQRDYDHPLDNFRRIAWFWSGLFTCKSCQAPVEVTEEEHALAMVLVKVARLMHSPGHRDSQVDIAGYAATIEKLQRERERRDMERLQEIILAGEEYQRSQDDAA